MVRRFLRAKKFLDTMFYAVRSGRNAGIYKTWDECKSQVDGYSGARFKKFRSRDEALNFIGGQSTVAKVHKRTSKPTFGGSQKNYGSSKEYNGDLGSYYHGDGSAQYYGGASSSIDEESLYQPNSPGYCQSCSSTYQQNSGAPIASTSYGHSSSVPRNSKKKSKKSSNVPVVYTDGGCFANGRRKASAGIGVYWGDGDKRNVSEKLEGHQTNQRAELNAAIRAIEGAAKSNMREVEVRTDSMYTINCATDWIKGWKRNGWKAATGGDVKNQQDIKRLDALGQQIKVNWVHVKAHSGVRGNEKADKLSKAGAMKSSK
eukprot:Seg2153.6 transcript_id=Seg2153.6/GoldUCD/mRNA.D3Y31 product="Ribonuclease H1" protein_id=Seg2153.6/GoldUCD/D3Y31